MPAPIFIELLSLFLCFFAGDHKIGSVPVAQNLEAGGGHLPLSYIGHPNKCHWLYLLYFLNHSPICPFLKTSSPEKATPPLPLP